MPGVAVAVSPVFQPAVSAGWSPSSESGLVVQLEADLGVAYFAGSSLVWSGQGGTSITASQAEANVPLYSSSPAYIQAGVGTDFLVLSSDPIVAGSTAHTVAFIAQNGSTATFQFGTDARDLSMNVAGAESDSLRVFVSAPGAASATFPTGTNVYTCVFRYDGSGTGDAERARAWVNGVEQSPTYDTETPWPANLTGGNANVTLLNSKFRSVGWDGKLIARIEWRSALDAAVIEADLNDYLNAVKARTGN